MSLATDKTTNTNDHLAKTHAILPLILGVLFAVVITAGDYGVYYHEHQMVTGLSATISQQQANIAALRQQITAVNNTNNGVVSVATNPASSNISLELIRKPV
jgi:hypothetical protein